MKRIIEALRRSFEKFRATSPVRKSIPGYAEFPLTLCVRFDSNEFYPKSFYRLVRQHAADLKVAHDVELEEHERERVSLDYLVDKYELTGDSQEKVRMAGIRSTVMHVGERARSASLEIDGDRHLISTADQWVRLVSSVPSFLQAYLIDREFDYWQNNTYLSSYENFGRSTKNLHTKSTGLPHPCLQWEVDTSDHPGRRLRNFPFDKAVASQMWFSDRFWSMVGKTREGIENEFSRSRVEHFAPSVCKITTGSQPFTDRAPPELLEELRQRLYDDRLTANP